MTDFKEVFELPNPGGGNLPVRSQGSRWISHKRKALQRLVNRYGAYQNHLFTLIADPSVKADDRAKLKGYALKWEQSKLLIGAALYIDVLKPLSLSLQYESLDIVGGIKSILKASKSLQSMSE